MPILPPGVPARHCTEERMASLVYVATNGPDDPTMAPAGVRRRGTGRALPRRGTRMAERFAKGMVVAVLCT